MCRCRVAASASCLDNLSKKLTPAAPHRAPPAGQSTLPGPRFVMFTPTQSMAPALHNQYLMTFSLFLSRVRLKPPC